jgi:hypothetical protein
LRGENKNATPLEEVIAMPLLLYPETNKVERTACRVHGTVISMISPDSSAMNMGITLRHHHIRKMCWRMIVMAIFKTSTRHRRAGQYSVVERQHHEFFDGQTGWMMSNERLGLEMYPKTKRTPFGGFVFGLLGHQQSGGGIRDMGQI